MRRSRMESAAVGAGRPSCLPVRRTVAPLALAGLMACAWPASAQIAPAPEAAVQQGWQGDLDRFRREVILQDAAFSADARELALGRLAALEQGLSRASDVEISAELARIAALAGNAHTRVDPLRNRGEWSRLPLRIWKFADGWRVIAARPEQADLLGARVVRIGGLSVADAEAKVAPLFAGNAAWSAYMASYSLTSPEALVGSGVIGRGPVVLTIEVDGRETGVTLAAEPSEGRTRPEENWWHLAARHPRTEGWRRLDAERTPLVFERAELGYAFARCSGGIGYLRLNRTMDQAGRPPLAAWGDQVLRELERDAPSRLVIDLRFNTGGDLSKALPFIGAIAASPLGRSPESLVVLINGQTFSAGITQAAWLRLHSEAEFIGEPVGDAVSFWAEGDNVVLPHSGLTARYSTGAHHYASGAPPENMRDHLFFTLSSPPLGPDREIAWTWADYAAGRDPVLEAAAPGLRCSPLE